MSSTIAAIRTDTENVAKDIDQVEQGFGRFSEQIADFKSTTKEFVAAWPPKTSSRHCGERSKPVTGARRFAA